MRTNIELNERLIREARRLSGLKTKRAIVEEALRLMVRMYRQKQVRKLRGKLEWKGDLEKMRESRFGSVG